MNDLDGYHGAHPTVWRRYILFLVAVFFAALIVYAPALYLPFHFDDAFFLGDDNVRLGRFGAFLVPPVPRFLSWLTLALQHRWHGSNPVPYHAFNILLHGANTVLVCIVLLLFLLRNRSRGFGLPAGANGALLPAAHCLLPAARCGLAAFMGALVFALHPIQTEPVYYVYQRSTLLASFFCFLALIAYMGGRTFWAWGFFLAAVASKEFAVVLPGVLWLFDWVWKGRLKPSRTVGILSSVAIGFVVLTKFQGGAAERTTVHFLRESLEYALTQVSVFWSYVSLVFLAGPLNLDHQVARSSGQLDSAWWLGGLSLVLMLALATLLRNKHPLPAFCCGVFLLFLLPTSSLVPSPDAMSEHRLYASMLGWAGIIAGFSLFLMEIARETILARGLLRSGALLAAGLLLAFYAVAVVDRGDVWQDPVTLWRDTVSKSPGKYRPNYNLGVLLMASAPREAVFYLNRAVAIDSSQPLAYRSLGEVYFKSGNLDSAEKTWRFSLSLDPGNADTHIALGRLYLHRKDFIKAREQLLIARNLEPLSPEVSYYLALANFQFGFYEDAIAECEKGLRIDGTRHRLRILLADIIAQTGDWARAIELYRESLQGAEESQSYYKLGRAYWATGQASEAKEAVRAGIRVAGSREDLRFGLWTLEQLGRTGTGAAQ